MAGSVSPRSARNACCSSPLELGDLGLDHRRHPAHPRLRAAGDVGQAVPLGDLLGLGDPRLLDVDECRIGFCDRKVKPRMIRVSSGVSGSRAQRRLAPPADALSRTRTACSGTSASLRCFLIDASSRSSRRSTTSRSARTSSSSRSRMSRRGSGAPRVSSGNARTTCRRASALRNSLASSAGALALLDAGEVDHLERGVRGLLRLEQRAQPIDAGVGHAGHAGVQLGAAAVVARRRHAGAGEEVEQRRLAALGEADESDLHGWIMPVGRRHASVESLRTCVVAPLSHPAPRRRPPAGPPSHCSSPSCGAPTPSPSRSGCVDAPPLRLAVDALRRRRAVIVAVGLGTGRLRGLPRRAPRVAAAVRASA